MKIILDCTANLGDFLNAMPVLSGIAKTCGLIDFTIRDDMSKFTGIKEFLMFQGIFSDVRFISERAAVGDLTFHANISSWTREDKANDDRPTETCRYENWMRDHFPHIPFEVDDKFEIKAPVYVDVPIMDGFYAGDRWHHKTDPRRRENIISHLDGCHFLDFTQPLLVNAYIIKNSTKPFVSCFTGVGILSDLMNKETYIVWKPEDFNEEFRRGDDNIWWDNKDIHQVFRKHYYGDRKSTLVLARDANKVIWGRE
jgi:hypothetical protein